MGKATNVAAVTAIDAAAERAGVVIADRAALLMLGCAVLYLSGWEVAIVLTVIQLLAAYWTDNDPQSWMEKSVFGKSPSSPQWTVDTA